MSQQLVLYDLDDGIAVLTLNHPERRNALSAAMLSELRERLDGIVDDRRVRVVVLGAAGPVFSSGHDLNELTGSDEEEHAGIFSQCTGVMEAIRALPQPVIARVQGLATAAGCQLVATCDLAVASQDATFATPGVSIGLFCTTPGVALARVVPTKKAMEMLLTGTPISARDALESGLVNRVVAPDELEAETVALARQVASASADTLAIGKSAFYRQLSADRPEAYRFAEKVMTENLRTPDAQEGIDAFLDKRDPKWTN